MTTCSSHLQGALHTLLPFHVGKVLFKDVLLFVELLAGVHLHGLISQRVTIKEADDVDDSLHAIDLQVVDNSRFAHILLRYDESLELLGTGADGDGQSTTNGLQSTIESQFAQEHETLQATGIHLVHSCQNADCQWQVVARAFLLKVSGCHVDSNISDRKFETRIAKGRLNAVYTFAYSSISQSRQMELRATCHTHLDGDGLSLQTRDSCTESLDQHRHHYYFRVFLMRSFSCVCPRLTASILPERSTSRL